MSLQVHANPGAVKANVAVVSHMLTLFVLLVLAYWPRLYNVMFAWLLVLRFSKYVDSRVGPGNRRLRSGMSWVITSQDRHESIPLFRGFIHCQHSVLV